MHRRFIDGFSPGYGWDGLAVALIGGLNPFGVVLASILFGALRSGGMVMNRVWVCRLTSCFWFRRLSCFSLLLPTDEVSLKKVC